MILQVKTVICRLILSSLVITACVLPSSAAFLDESFVTLLPSGTQAIKRHFSFTIVLRNANTSLDLYKQLERIKPTIAFFSPLLTGELLSIVGTYPKIVPVVIANADIPVQSFSNKGYAIIFNREPAIQQAVLYFNKAAVDTIETGILAIITDIKDIDTLKIHILKEFPPASTGKLQFEFYSAEDSAIGTTIEQLKQKNISYAVISVNDSRLVSLLDALVSEPEILAVIQGEPPQISHKLRNHFSYVHWDIARTLKSIKFSKTLDRWIQVEGAWKISK